MKAVLDQILEVYQTNGDAEISRGMKDYMRGQFDYFGIKSPLRREISKPFIKEVSKESKENVYALIEMLWKQPQRECHYIALDLFYKVAKKMLEKKDMPFLEWMIQTNSWWDTIDGIAPKIFKIYFDKFPEERDKKVDVWIASDNIWLQRSALLFQLKQKDEVDLNFMFKTIKRLTGTNEFFINKAIGWLLREHSKKIPGEIEEFIEENKEVLSNLSIREGIKYL
jgi:3-methyladenine DNA glycosylase AlkD